MRATSSAAALYSADGGAVGEEVVAWEQSLGRARSTGASFARPKKPPPLPVHMQTYMASPSSARLNVAAPVYERQVSASRMPVATKPALLPAQSSTGIIQAQSGALPSAEELADEALAESSARHLAAELQKALVRIDRQRVEIESLRGLRASAISVANEEAMRRGKTWGGDEVRRFSALQKAPVPPPSSPFHSDEMKEVMGQAIVATTRRLTHAVKESSRARVESERAEGESMITLEQAFPSRNGIEPNEIEQKAKLTMRALLVGTSRTTAKLRAAVLRLEEEVVQARANHAADVRSLTARLVAEREAMHATMSLALQSSETEGEYSISGLQAELVLLESRHSSTEMQMIETIDQLGLELEQTRDKLEAEQRTRAKDNAQLTDSVHRLEAEVARLRGELEHSQEQHQNDVMNLTRELQAEKQARAKEALESERQAAEAASNSKAAIAAVENRLAETREQGYAARDELQRKLKEVSNSKDAVEGRLTRQLRLLDERREYEKTMLKSRNEVLTHQVLALRANTSRGRQDLYWASLKSGGAVPMPGPLQQSSSASRLASQSPSRRAASPAPSSTTNIQAQDRMEFMPQEENPLASTV